MSEEETALSVQPHDQKAAFRARDLAAIHRDVDFANRYRLEASKITLGMAAGVFAFTVSFVDRMVPETSEPMLPGLMFVGWVLLALSIAFGLFHMLRWEMYYISFRDYSEEDKVQAGENKRKRITWWGGWARGLQGVMLVLGMLAIGLFCWLNI